MGVVAACFLIDFAGLEGVKWEMRMRARKTELVFESGDGDKASKINYSSAARTTEDRKGGP